MKKFDFVIGNPPYQEETAKNETDNGQKTVKNIFQLFQQEVDKVTGTSSVLIYPGIRWLHQSGKGLKNFGYEQINDERLQTIVFYPNAREVFFNTKIPDGITIVVKKTKKTKGGFQYIYVENGHVTQKLMDNPGNDLLPLNPLDVAIIAKIIAFVKNKNLAYLHDSILPRSLFNIDSDFVEKNGSRVLPYNENMKFDDRKYVKLFTNDQAGSKGRAKWFLVEKDVITSNQEYISKWQVIVSSAHAGGQENRDNQMEIVDKHSAFGRSRVALKSFDTKAEALNFFNYAQSTVVKYCFLMTDEALTSLAKRVPDLLNYSDNNALVNFRQNIDNQLFSLLKLTKAEIKRIKVLVQQAAPVKRKCEEEE